MNVFAAALTLIIVLTSPAWSRTQVVEQEATQIVGDGQSINDVRNLAMLEAKRLATEQVGTYVEALTVVKEARVAKDEILMFTSALMTTEVLGEGKRLEGNSILYWIRIKAAIDTDTMERRVQKILSDNQLRDQLEEQRRRTAELEAANRELLAQLQNAKSEQERVQIQKAAQKLSQAWSADELAQRAAAAASWEDLNEAERLYTSALELDATHGAALSGLGWVLDKRGRLNEAEALLRRSLSANPTNLHALTNLSGVLIKRGRFEEARQISLQATRLDPKHVAAHNHLGHALRALGQMDEARRVLLKAIDLDPTYAEAYVNLGNVYWQQQKWHQAKGVYELALILDPSNQIAKEHLEKLKSQRRL